MHNYNIMKDILLIIVSFSIISLPQTHNIEIPHCVDISINEIILHDTISSRNILGAENITHWQYGPVFEFKFLNKHKTQLLTCTFHPGDYLYSLSEFKVEMNITDRNISIDTSSTKITVLEEILNFKTEREIELGIDSIDIIKILGRPNRMSNENGIDIFCYEIKNPLDFQGENIVNDFSEFFDHFNTHMYYGNYKFRNGKLIEFSFGFPYP